MLTQLVQPFGCAVRVAPLPPSAPLAIGGTPMAWPISSMLASMSYSWLAVCYTVLSSMWGTLRYQLRVTRLRFASTNQPSGAPLS